MESIRDLWDHSNLSPFMQKAFSAAKEELKDQATYVREDSDERDADDSE